MAVGALISAYQEDDSGQLRALFPLAGRSLLEYQIRCVAAAGASPIVIVVERVPQALQDIFERLKIGGIDIFPVSDVHEAVSRFEAGSMILMLGDGVVAPPELIASLADEPDPAIAVVADDEANAAFERIDAGSRWSGAALIDVHLLNSTASMLGDWDLQSTLLRRAVQDGARRIACDDEWGRSIVVESADQLGAFERVLMDASRPPRTDWPSRFVLAPFEEMATARMMNSHIRPAWLVWGALTLSVAAAVAFLFGWLAAGLALLILSAPLDLIAARLANLRLQPLAARMPSRRALWLAAGLAAVALGWWEAHHGHGWAPLVAAVSACAFAEAARIEKLAFPAEIDLWLISRKGAIFLAIPFALLGAWTAFLVILWLYAATSFFIAQNARHSVKELTPN